MDKKQTEELLNNMKAEKIDEKFDFNFSKPENDIDDEKTDEKLLTEFLNAGKLGKKGDDKNV